MAKGGRRIILVRLRISKLPLLFYVCQAHCFSYIFSEVTAATCSKTDPASATVEQGGSNTWDRQQFLNSLCMAEKHRFADNTPNTLLVIYLFSLTN